MPDKWGERTCLQAQNKCCRRRIEPNLVPRLFSRKWRSQEQYCIYRLVKKTAGLAGLWNQFQSSLTDILRQLETATLGGEAYDYISFWLEQLSRHLLRIIQLHYTTFGGRSDTLYLAICCQTCVVINNCLLSTLRQLKHVGLDDQNLVYRVESLNIYCHLTLHQPI